MIFGASCWANGALHPIRVVQRPDVRHMWTRTRWTSAALAVRQGPLHLGRLLGVVYLHRFQNVDFWM
jgi:hypothetical protein